MNLFGLGQRNAGNLQEVQDLRIADLESLIGELMQEAGTDQRLFDLALEDIGWSRMGGSSGGLETLPHLRESIVKRARTYAIHDPVVVHGLRLWRDFIIGRGISVRAQDERANKVVQDFWTDPGNRRLLSCDGLRRSVDILNVDGEIAFALFQANNGPKIRRIDCLQITEVVSDPDDAESIWGYSRRYTDAKNKQHKIFYWDMFCPEDARRAENVPAKHEEEPNAIVRFQTINTLGKRGNSLLTCVLDWAKGYRKFMEARHAIQQSLARFAWKHKVKGGYKAVAQSISYHRSGLGTGGSGQMDNPPAAPASIWSEDESGSLDPIRIDTGAAAAQVDGDMLLQMTGLGMGFMPPWLGSGTNAKFSTSDSMEIPMLKELQAGQEFWGDIYRDVLMRMLSDSGIKEDESLIDIDFPEIIPQNVPLLLQSIGQVFMAMPELAELPEVKMLVLSSLGINNVDEVVAKMKERPKYSYAPETPDAQQDAVVKATEALRALAESMKG